MSRRATGELGESLALGYLVRKGYELVERNYRTRHGEIDLILRGEDVLVFVEVKARRGRGFGDPLEAVTRGSRNGCASWRRLTSPSRGRGSRRGSRRCGSTRSG
ncbi:YraN family protein [Rubrobacter marinus]|uniref:YraN family protein n=1 Tax=Rubrobacter marinus TaxID=2653852 RepID=UPI00140B4459|nr:YraN family protein [Rubrobacter marinus]